MRSCARMCKIAHTIWRADVAEVTRLYGCGDPYFGAGHWREHRHLQRGERGPAPAASLSQGKPAGLDLVAVGQRDARARVRSGIDGAAQALPGFRGSWRDL